jgi:hypothetical protein
LIVIIALIYLSPFYNKVRSRPVLFIGNIKAGRVYNISKRESSKGRSNKEKKKRRGK